LGHWGKRKKNQKAGTTGRLKEQTRRHGKLEDAVHSRAALSKRRKKHRSARGRSPGDKRTQKGEKFKWTRQGEKKRATNASKV